MLSHRGRRILFELIREYLATGEAVSSGVLASRGDRELSSASIRAVFAELDAHELLHKPHASAGRVPTARGLRLFVDALLASADLTEPARQDLERRFAEMGPGLDAAMRHAGRVLANVTGSASIVVASPRPSWVLQDLRFMPMRADEVLAVMVASNGAVQHRVVRTGEPISPADLERANNQLRELLGGHTLPEIRQILLEQLVSERGQLDQTLRFALQLGERATAGAATEHDVIVEGTSQLIGRADFTDIVQARRAIETLEDRERLVTLLDRTIDAPGIEVLISGDETHSQTEGLSFVVASFGHGSIAVAGPARMDYPTVVPVVRHAALLLKRALN